MDKVFKNKKLTYVIIAILLALQLTQSIANWVGGGFNGGSLILCILMLGLLTLVGVGIAKKNKLLTIVSGVAILSVLIYILASTYSGLIKDYIDGRTPISSLVANIFGSVGALLLIGDFVLIILKAFKVTKNLKAISTVFSVIAAVMFLILIIVPFATNSPLDATFKTYLVARDLFALFAALLIPCVWHQLDVK